MLKCILSRRCLNSPINHVISKRQLALDAALIFEKIVPPLSKLVVNSKLNIAIKPSDVEGHNVSPLRPLKIYTTSPAFHEFTEEDENKFILNLRGLGDCVTASMCILEVPVQSALHVTCFGSASARIKHMLSDNVYVKTDEGNIETKNIRSGLIHLHSNSGNISCSGVLQGSLFLKTGNSGSVKMQRLQGNCATVETENGNIESSSSYCDTSVFKTKGGNINLNNLHRTCTIDIQRGNLSISGLDGSVEANVGEGDMKIEASIISSKSLFKTESGNIHLGIQYLNSCDLDLTGAEIYVPTFMDDIKYRNEVKYGDAMLKTYRNMEKDSPKSLVTAVTSSGIVTVKSSDWITSLKLNTKK